MASIRSEIVVSASPDEAWAAVRDVGRAHELLFPGILTDVRLDGDARVATFGNGMVVRELIVDLDDAERRFVYASVGGRATHHNSSIQVLPHEGGSRLIWITDLLPHALRPAIAALVEQGSAVMKATLDARARAAG
jgi:carbon monoxide dehydrogenase subunit G